MQKENFKYIAASLAFLFIIDVTGAQSDPKQLQKSDTTFFDIFDRLDTYYRSLNTLQFIGPLEDEEDGDMANFYRWANFWQNRLEDNGMPNYSGSAMTDFIDGGLTVCTSEDDNHIDWRSLGPHNAQGALGGSEPGGSNNCSGLLPDRQNHARIQGISVHPYNPDTILAGGSQGGIWVTENGGSTWLNTTDADGFSIAGTTNIIRHPADPNIIYASTGTDKYQGTWGLGRNYGIGVIRSDDGGYTWKRTGYFSNHVFDIVIDPSSTLDSTTLYIGLPWGLIKKTGNYKATGPWNQIYSVGNHPRPYHFGNGDVTDIEIQSNGTVWFCTVDGLYKIPAGTEIVDTISNYIVPSAATVDVCGQDNPVKREISIDINMQDHVVVSILYWKTNLCLDDVIFTNETHITKIRFLYRSIDDGASWEMVQLGEKDLTNHGHFVMSPYNSDILYIERGPNIRCMFKYTNFWSGFNVQAMDNKENHVDVRKLIVYSGVPGDANGDQDILFVGTDGGISRTTNGFTWEDISGEGMAGSNYYGVGITEADGDYIFGGAQDGNINFYNHGSWYETGPGADNGDCLIHPEDKTIVYQQSQNLLYKTTVNLSTNNVSTSSISTNGRVSWLYHMIFNPNDPNEIFLAGNENLLNYNESMGPVITVPSSVHAADKRLSSVAMSEANNDVVYYSRQGFFFAEDASAEDDRNRGGIFRADRSSGSWVVTDLTTLDLRTKCRTFNFELLCGLPASISDITVDPYNEDKVWISFGGSEAGHKIFKSTDGGTTWINDSGCLPDIPFTALVYQKGTNNRVYAGSDFGVFYKDDSMTDWAYYGNNGPRTLVADMEINHCAGKLVVATQGRGMWEADLLMKPTDELIVSTSQIWNTSRRIATNLRLMPGVELTVQDATINMAKDCQITIEATATLILDNSTLTNGCDETWVGVKVLGNNSIPQTSDNQGRIIMQNNSEVSNAGLAFSLWDGTVATSGAYIDAQDSRFINNRRSIEVISYGDVQGGILQPSKNRFVNCSFVIDDNYPHDKAPLPHVTIWDQYGIEFTNTDFANDQSFGNSYFGMSTGILSDDAHYIVTGGIFSGFGHGIECAVINDPSRNIEVRNATFEENVVGITNSGVNNMLAEGNTFQVGQTALPSNVSHGFELIGPITGTSRIMDNDFIRIVSVSNTSKRGIYVVGLGTDANLLHQNRFTDLGAGQFITGNNRNGADEFGGLRLECNTNTSNVVDFFVGGSSSISYFQGSPLRPAGNTFSHNNVVTPFSDFYNFGGQAFYYYANKDDPGQIMDYYTETSIFQELVTATNDCLASATDDPELAYQGHVDALDAKMIEYNAKVDGGNTTTLLFQISIVTTGTAASTKTNLLSISPYLSLDVLKAVVDKVGVFGQPSVIDILVANPEVLQQGEILTYLNSTIQGMAILDVICGDPSWKTVSTERGDCEVLISQLELLYS